MIKQKAVIFDIDGVLAKKSPDRDFREYDKVDLDLPIDINLKIVNFFGTSYQTDSRDKIIFITGRKELCRDKTIKWLLSNFQRVAKKKSFNAYEYYINEFDFKNSALLFMRADKCHQESDELKRNIYNKHIKDKYDVVAVFEDDPKNVKMFRELGLMVFDVGQDNK